MRRKSDVNVEDLIDVVKHAHKCTADEACCARPSGQEDTMHYIFRKVLEACGVTDIAGELRVRCA